MTTFPSNSNGYQDQLLTAGANESNLNSKSQSYSFSMKSDLQPLFYIGLILFCPTSFLFFVDNPTDIIAELPWLPTFLILCLVCSLIGILFWKITKQLSFSAEMGKITLKILRFSIPLYSRTFLIKDCINFDIQFFPRQNASYLVLHHNEKKPIKLQIKKKKDDVHTHLLALNAILSSIKCDKYPSSLPKIQKNSIDEENRAFDQKRKIIRDVDNQITMSTNYFKVVSVIFPFLSFGIAYVSYLLFWSRTPSKDSILLIFSFNLLFALNFLGIIYFIFMGIRVKDPHIGNQNEILSGNPLFKSPKFLQNLVSKVKTTYIEPEQIKIYKKIRLGLMISGFIPIFAAFVFYLFYLF